MSNRESIAEKLEWSNMLIQESIGIIELKMTEVNAKLALSYTKPVTHWPDNKGETNPRLVELNVELQVAHRKIGSQKAKMEKLKKTLVTLEQQGGKDLVVMSNQARAID